MLWAMGGFEEKATFCVCHDGYRLTRASSFIICNFKLCVINSLAIIEGLNYL